MAPPLSAQPAKTRVVDAESAGTPDEDLEFQQARPEQCCGNRQLGRGCEQHGWTRLADDQVEVVRMRTGDGSNHHPVFGVRLETVDQNRAVGFVRGRDFFGLRRTPKAGFACLEAVEKDSNGGFDLDLVPPDVRRVGDRRPGHDDRRGRR